MSYKNISMVDAANYYAWCKNNPIKHSYQLTEEQLQNLKTTPPDPKWQEDIDTGMWWAHKNFAAMQRGAATATGNDGRFWDLHVMLMAFGGYETCFGYKEPDMAEILKYGQLWIGDHVVEKPREMGRAHVNSALVWLEEHEKRDLGLATGYALCDDGLWRQHTWLVRRNRGYVSVWETSPCSTKRVAYFGFVMTDAQAAAFAEENR